MTAVPEDRFDRLYQRIVDGARVNAAYITSELELPVDTLRSVAQGYALTTLLMGLSYDAIRGVPVADIRRSARAQSLASRIIRESVRVSAHHPRFGTGQDRHRLAEWVVQGAAEYLAAYGIDQRVVNLSPDDITSPDGVVSWAEGHNILLRIPSELRGFAAPSGRATR